MTWIPIVGFTMTREYMLWIEYLYSPVNSGSNKKTQKKTNLIKWNTYIKMMKHRAHQLITYLEVQSYKWLDFYDLWHWPLTWRAKTIGSEQIFPRCMECQRGLATRKLSVRPSVCQTRGFCDKTEERSVQIFIPYERSFILVFWEKECLVGRPLLPEILGQAYPVGAKSTIFSRFSLVAPQR